MYTHEPNISFGLKEYGGKKRMGLKITYLNRIVKRNGNETKGRNGGNDGLKEYGGKETKKKWDKNHLFE